MPTPFDSFGYVEASQTVRRADTAASLSGLVLNPIAGILGTGVADSSPQSVNIGSLVQLVRSMLDGDMWLDGFGWIGPRPGPTEDGYPETMRLLQQGFISENVIAEVIDRHVAGILGREPQWSFTPRRHLKNDEDPTEAEMTAIGEAEALVTEWWDARKVHKFLETAARTLLYARRSVVRLYVPRGKLVSENVPDPANANRVKTVKMIRASDVPAGLAFVWPDAPLPEKSTVSEDPDTKESIGVVLFRYGQNVTGTSGDREVAELTYLAEPNAGGNPLTIVRQSSTGAPDSAATRFDYGGRISMYEMTRSPFVTAQLIQLQRALNLTLSALPRNVITAGWLERVILNAQMPGKYIKDASAPTGQRWIPDKHTTGGGSTMYLKGLKQEDQSTGATSYASPSVNWREPSPVQPTVEAQEALYRGMLREAKQEHVLMSQDVKASGKSREQARADFEMTLAPTASEMNACGRWLLETALAMAEAFSGQVGKYTGTYRATFECQIDTGPLTAQERTAIDASVAAGTLSRETAMALENIADPAAEIARINAQPGADMEIVAKQAVAFAALVNAGADIEGAALAVGMDPEIAAALVPQFAEPAAVDASGNPIPAPANGGPPTNGNGTNGKRKMPRLAPVGRQAAKPASAGGTGADASGDSGSGLPADQSAG